LIVGGVASQGMAPVVPMVLPGRVYDKTKLPLSGGEDTCSELIVNIVDLSRLCLVGMHDLNDFEAKGRGLLTVTTK